MLPEGVPAFAACGVHCQVLSEQPVVSGVPDPGHAPGPRQLSGTCVPLASRINVLGRRSKLYFHKFTPLHQCQQKCWLFQPAPYLLSSQFSSSSSWAWKVPPDPHHWVYKSHYPFTTHLNSGKHSESSREFSLTPKPLTRSRVEGRGLGTDSFQLQLCFHLFGNLQGTQGMD